MFKPAILSLPIAMLFCCQLCSAQSNMNKCSDGTQITYTDKTCKKLGLKPAGPIKNTVTIVPAITIKPPHVLTPIAKQNIAEADISQTSSVKPTSPPTGKTLRH